LEEAERLADEFPGPAIAIGWQAVESEIAAAFERVGVKVDSRMQRSPVSSMEKLVANGSVEMQFVDLLKRMRNLRNTAVHIGFSPTGIPTEQALEFIALARGAIHQLKKVVRAE
jgi:hypothetical protein